MASAAPRSQGTRPLPREVARSALRSGRRASLISQGRSVGRGARGFRRRLFSAELAAEGEEAGSSARKLPRAALLLKQEDVAEAAAKRESETEPRTIS